MYYNNPVIKNTTNYPIVLKLRNHNTPFPPQCPICKKPIVKGELFYNRRYFETHVACVTN